MTDDSAGFFAQIAYGGPTPDVPEGIERDQWGRPLVVDPATGEMVAYTRASTMAGYIDNAHGLHTWQMRLLAQGMGHREDLAAMAAALPPYAELKKAQKDELQEIIDAALDTAKAFEKANWGTAIHAFTDPLQTSGPVPARMQADVASHEAVVEAAGLVRFASEVFVVNDELKVAGTLDAIIGVPALEAMLVGDTKTGRQDLHKTVIQVAIYRGGQVYDWNTHARTPIEEYVASLHPNLTLPPLHPTAGLYTHIPRGEGRTTLHPLDLSVGRYMADICAIVRDWKKRDDFVKDDVTGFLEQKRNVAALKAITDATTLEELRAAYTAYAWCWNERLDKAGTARYNEIGAPRA